MLCLSTAVPSSENARGVDTPAQTHKIGGTTVNTASKKGRGFVKHKGSRHHGDGSGNNIGNRLNTSAQLASSSSKDHSAAEGREHIDARKKESIRLAAMIQALRIIPKHHAPKMGKSGRVDPSLDRKHFSSPSKPERSSSSSKDDQSTLDSSKPAHLTVKSSTILISTMDDWLKTISSLLDSPAMDLAYLSQILQLIVTFARKSHTHEVYLRAHLQRSTFMKEWKSMFFVAAETQRVKTMQKTSETLLRVSTEDAIQIKDYSCNPVVLSSMIHCFGALKILPGKEFIETWYELCQDLSEWDCQGLTISLWAFGKLDLRPSMTFLSRFYVRAEELRSRLSSQEIGLILWSLAKLRCTIPTDFMFICMEIIELREKAADLQMVANSMWAFGKLGHMPRASTLESLQTSFVRESYVKDVKDPNYHQEIINVIWAYARLKMSPERGPFRDRLLECVSRCVSTMDAHGLSSTMWALGKLEIVVDSVFLQAFYARFVLVQRKVTAQGLSNVLWSLAKLKIKPDQSSLFWQAWQKSFHQNAKSLSCLSVSNIMWSFGQLELSTAEDFMSDWYSAFQRLRPGFNHQQLANILWGFGKLGIEFRPEFLSEWMVGFEKEMLKMNDQELANIIWAFGKLGSRMPPTLVRQWFFSFELRMLSFSSQGLTNVLWALAKMEVQPKESFLIQWYICAIRKLKAREVSPQDLSLCMWALGKLRLESDSEYLGAWSQAFLAQQEAFKSQEVSNIIWGFARLRIKPGKDVLAKWYSLFYENTDKFNGQEVSIILWALGRLQLSPDSHFMSTWYSLFTRTQESMDYLGLTNSLEAFSQLGIQPNEEFLRTWLSAFKRTLPSAPKDFLQLYNTFAVERFGTLVRKLNSQPKPLTTT